MNCNWWQRMVLTLTTGGCLVATSLVPAEEREEKVEIKKPKIKAVVEEADQVKEQVIEMVVGDEGVKNRTLKIVRAPEGLLGKKFFLGLQMGELPALLKSQLSVEHGIVVTAIIPESPAAKAGLAQHDILLQAGDKKLAQPQDLLTYVEESKGAAVELKVLRGGKEIAINITPGDRPEKFQVPLPSADDGEVVEHFFVRPGVFLKAPAVIQKLPSGVQIQINKSGNEPAKIVVKDGEKTWETTADKLDVLPEKLRPHLERMLGVHGSGNVDLDVIVNRDGPAVKLGVQSKNLDETIEKWMPAAQGLLKEAAQHQEQGKLIEEALRRAMVFAQRNQAVVATPDAPLAEGDSSRVVEKLDSILMQMEELQNRLRAVEAGLEKK